MTNQINFKRFYNYLHMQNFSENTILSYSTSVKYFLDKYKSLSKSNLINFRQELIRHYKPKTVNLRIQAINHYLKFIHKEKLQLTFLRIQQNTFLENIISDNYYNLFKKRLLHDDREKWYFIVWFLGATGIRIGELIKIKIEDLLYNQQNSGFIDIYSKGEKIRRIYIPKILYSEIQKWITSENRTSGYLFLNRFGNQISTRGIAIQLKTYAKQYNIPLNLVHPHAFRHFFAKKFLSQCSDITLLADLLGHENLSTTRLYLRRSSSEQQMMINKIVKW